MSVPMTSIAQAATHGTGVLTQTRYVRLFGELEAELLKIAEAHDGVRVDQMLASTFEVRKANGDVIPRADWIKQMMENPHPEHNRTISKLIVYEIGAHAVANFNISSTDKKRGLFVVDVWAPENGQWILRARIESDLPREFLFVTAYRNKFIFCRHDVRFI